MGISAKHKLFAEAVASGATKEASYKKAGYISTGKTARTSADRLMKNAGVLQVIEEIQQKAKSNAILTATEIKEGLSRMMGKAEAAGDFTGFSSLSDRLCKMEGYYTPEQVEHKLVGKEEIADRVRKVSPLIAEKLEMARRGAIDAVEVEEVEEVD